MNSKNINKKLVALVLTLGIPITGVSLLDSMLDNYGLDEVVENIDNIKASNNISKSDISNLIISLIEEASICSLGASLTYSIFVIYNAISKEKDNKDNSINNKDNRVNSKNITNYTDYYLDKVKRDKLEELMSKYKFNKITNEERPKVLIKK